jgi:hypothetical protein
MPGAGDGGAEGLRRAARAAALWIRCTRLAPRYSPVFAPQIEAFCTALAGLDDGALATLAGVDGVMDREGYARCAQEWGARARSAA